MRRRLLWHIVNRPIYTENPTCINFSLRTLKQTLLSPTDLLCCTPSGYLKKGNVAKTGNSCSVQLTELEHPEIGRTGTASRGIPPQVARSCCEGQEISAIRLQHSEIEGTGFTGDRATLGGIPPQLKSSCSEGPPVASATFCWTGKRRD